MKKGRFAPKGLSQEARYTFSPVLSAAGGTYTETGGGGGGVAKRGRSRELASRRRKSGERRWVNKVSE